MLFLPMSFGINSSWPLVFLNFDALPTHAILIKGSNRLKAGIYSPTLEITLCSSLTFPSYINPAAYLNDSLVVLERRMQDDRAIFIADRIVVVDLMIFADIRYNIVHQIFRYH